MSVKFSGRYLHFKRFAIGPANRPPSWGLAAGSLGDLNGGVLNIINLVASDPDGDALTFAAISGALPPGMAISGNTLTGTPVNTPGVFAFTLRVLDGYGGKADRSFSLTVTNQSPVWQTASGALPQVTIGQAYSKQLSATDPNGDTVSYAVTSGALPSGLTLNSNGLIQGTVSMGAGTYNFTVTASDPVGGSTSRAFSVGVNNQAPVWQTASGALPQATIGQAYSKQLVATDANGDSITYALTSGSLPNGLTLNSSGLIQGTVNSGSGTFGITVAASDALGASSSRSFSIALNTAPVWSTGTSLPFARSGVAYSTTLVATDPNADAITYSAIDALPAGITLNTSGVLSGTPSLIAVSEDKTFTIRASDGKGSSDRTFTLRVGAVGLMVAGDGGKVAVSREGSTWTVHQTAVAGFATGVTTASGGFEAATTDGKVINGSQYGEIWGSAAAVMSGTGAAAHAIAKFGTDRMMVGVNAGANRYAYDFGSGWAVNGTNFANRLNCILKQDTPFNYAVIVAGNNGYMASTINNSNWTARSSGFGTSNINDIYSDSAMAYVICGDGGKISVVSYDWTYSLKTTGVTANLYRIRKTGNVWLCGGANGTLITSPDANTWTSRNTGFGTSAIRAIGYFDGIYVIAGDNGKLATSTDLVTWTLRTSGFGSTETIRTASIR